MSLRPRYSLLTLLLLTALVAGGVKLWRGPHRVVYLQPFPSNLQMVESFESRLTDQYQSYEFEYVREWSGKKFRYQAGRLQENIYLVKSAKRDDAGKTLWHWLVEWPEDSPLFQAAEPAARDRIVFWILAPLDGRPFDATSTLQPNGRH